MTTTTTPQFVTSADGTRIACETHGTGPALILVDGAMCRRQMGPSPALWPLLADAFAVTFYDRRGRGDSGDAAGVVPGQAPADVVDREIDDLIAVAAAVAGDAGVFVYGSSSGAMLAARATARGLKVKKLVLHEPPLALDGTRVPEPIDYQAQIGAFVANHKPGDAVKLFMRVVGVPAPALVIMRFIPGLWKKLTVSAHTLPYDFALLGDTQTGGPLPVAVRDVFARIAVPTLLLVGGKSPPYMHHAVKTAAALITTSTTTVLPGQEHNVSPKAIAPRLRAFFT